MGRVRSSVAIAASLAVAALAVPGVASAKPPAGTKKARTFSGTPTVGALFDSATSKTHFCTASVVASPRGDLLITAAHCVQGTAKGWSFAPGFHHGVSPYGRWRVSGLYLDPQWIADQNPQRDYAFLTVAPKRVGGHQEDIQTVTGANGLSSGPKRGETVTVPAYPHGQANDPITCTAKVYFDGLFPAFNCNPYVDGTSGSPWLATTPNGIMIAGLIAGCTKAAVTPTPPTARHSAAMRARSYQRAVTGAKPDVAPKAGSDGCSTGL